MTTDDALMTIDDALVTTDDALTMSWQVIRIKGEGMPKHGTPSEFGDLTITFSVDFPTTVEAALAQGLEKLLPTFSASDLRILSS
jgi:DnaJ-class molecular chaperone